MAFWSSTHENISQVNETNRLRLSEYARSGLKGQAGFALILPPLLPLEHTAELLRIKMRRGISEDFERENRIAAWRRTPIVCGCK